MSQQHGNFKTKIERDAERFDFFTPIYKTLTDKDGEAYTKLTGVTFSPLKVLNRLKQLGYVSLEIDRVRHLVRIIDGRAISTDPEQIGVHVRKILEEMPDEMPDGVTREMVLNKFLNSEDRSLKPSLLKHLDPEKEIEFYEDTRDAAYFFYSNGTVKVTKDEIKLLPPDKSGKIVWETQVLNREFKPKKDYDKGVWARFCKNIAGKDDPQRQYSLKTITGYLLHKHFERKMRAVFVTDGRISDEADGRSGKTIYGRGFGYMLNQDIDRDRIYTEIPGKEFDQTKATKYELAELGTKLIHLNDVITAGRDKISVEKMFNDISDGTKIRKMYQSPFIIKNKYLITGNRALKIRGGSAIDRFIEMELADYYSQDFSPYDEFKCWLFSDDWNADDWADFDNYQLSCVQEYFRSGVIAPHNLNLNQMKLILETGQEFIDFMEDLEIKTEIKYPKVQMRMLFHEKYPERERYTTAKKFTQMLIAYADYMPEFESPSDFKGGREKRNRRFMPRNVTCDIDLENPGGDILPIEDAIIFYPSNTTS